MINRSSLTHPLHNRFVPWLATAVILVALLLTTGQNARPALADSAETLYIVLLADPPLATYQGGISGLAPTAPTATGEGRLDPDSAAGVAYRTYLASQQVETLATIAAALGRSVDVAFQYDTVLNGFAVYLAPAEADITATLPGVSRVEPDSFRVLLTDAGPDWIGAPAVWDGSATGGLPGNQGEGVVVGIIDTGVNHDHPSFADPGPVDNYDYANPRGLFLGLCDPLTGLPFCNDKLIGVYDFTGTGPEDDNGHGSHTASTTAGNVVEAAVTAPTISLNRTISGVAPHANIITYKACVTTPAIGTCPISALLAGINQATLDQVDVINYSIGGSSSDPWSDLDAQAFFGARSAGIFVATSAGNSGPGAATLGSPADAPWVLSVAASTHNRNFVNALVAMSGGASTAPADMTGKSVTSGYGPATVVYAGDYGNNLCGSGTAEAPLNPFSPGTFNGEIVVCDRGTYARVDKARFVGEAGAGGFVLANDAESGDSLVGDAYAVPGVHITYADGVVLKAWLAGGSGHSGSITGTTADESPANGDIMASFSSRGPNPAAADLVKPDVTAPGVDILAAFNSPPSSTEPEYNAISGTSMSSPHAAGAAALLRAVHPDWTPDEVKSALMTTAFNNLPGDGNEVHEVYKEDGTTAADPFDMGAGRVNLWQAAQAGLVLDEAPANYEAANPAGGGDPKTLNLPSMGNGNCVDTCTWIRTVRNATGGTVTWTAVSAAPAGFALTISPATFTLAPGATQEISVEAAVAGLAPQWQFAQINLIPDNAAIPTAHLPVAVIPQGAAPPQLALHFQGNLDEGCSGNGAEDILLCDGPFLSENPLLDENPAATWGPVSPVLTGTADRNIYDPNWVWHLDQPTTLAGLMTVEWWASCAGCGPFSADWYVRLWADGAQVFEQRVTATPAAPGLPSLLATTVALPEVTANTNFVLQLDPVYIDSQQGTIIYYDSSDACPGAATGPCDSIAHMPVVGLTPPPPTGEAIATGGGWLATDDGKKINFGFQVETTADGPEGDLQLNDKSDGAKIAIDELTAITAVTDGCGSITAGDHALAFTGSGTFNGNDAEFRVCVEDNGEPGKGVDNFYLECVNNCNYNTGAGTPDDTIDGGNIQVEWADDGAGDGDGTNSSTATASTLILDPLLLTDGIIGAAQLFTVKVYDQNQAQLADVTVTLTRTGANGSVTTLTALTDLTGTAVFTLANLTQVSEYIATAGDVESNTIEISPLLR